MTGSFVPYSAVRVNSEGSEVTNLLSFLLTATSDKCSETCFCGILHGPCIRENEGCYGFVWSGIGDSRSEAPLRPRPQNGFHFVNSSRRVSPTRE